MNVKLPFWRTKSLLQMTHEEWESLCDGCGQCCLHKVRVGSGKLMRTNVACRMLNPETCRCGNYPKRKQLVPDCVILTPHGVFEADWLPDTCAYRLVAEGKNLFDWHYLVSGDRESVHRAGISVRSKCVSERTAGPLTKHIEP
jgi:uncharacterized cysteine cluster protein YcgN (CxxCxxCC family)